MYVDAGGNDSFTKLLIHPTGVNGGTTITDVSASAHTLTANGNAQISTAQFVFGGPSILFDGATDYLSTADSADWVLGTNSFVFDLRMRAAVIGGGVARTLLFQGPDVSNFVHFFTDTNSTIGFRAISGGVNVGAYSTTVTPAINTWYHIAYVRSGSSFFIRFDGVSQGLTTITAIGASSIPDYAAALTIGDNTVAPSGFNGHLQEIRLSNGTDRGWTSNFSPYGASYD